MAKKFTQKAISLPFYINDSGSVEFSSNENKIWRDRVFLVLMTLIDERVMVPSFGSEIKTTIFENESFAREIVNATVTQAFGSWLTELTLLNVNTELDVQTMQLQITINYRLPSLAQDTITLLTGTFTRSGDLIEE